MWVTAGVAVVVAAAVVILAAFLEGEPRPAPRRTGAVTPQELRSVDLPTSWRGYDRGYVDALLARAALTLDEVRRYGPEVHDDADTTPVGGAGAPPSFLAGTLAADPGPDPDDEVESDPPPRGEAADGSGEELEDRGRDGAGGLDG
jgi:DivIVA domain-containing protein